MATYTQTIEEYDETHPGRGYFSSRLMTSPGFPPPPPPPGPATITGFSPDEPKKEPNSVGLCGGCCNLL